MKHLTTILFFLLISTFLFAQNAGTESAQIKKQMSEIRKTTDWNNPEEAKKANTQIEVLSAKLTQALRKEKQAAQPGSVQEIHLPEQEADVEIQQQIDDYNNKLWNQMMNIVREEGSWDLAKPLRDEIVQEYKDDEDPTIKNQEFLNEMTFLYIDMSSPNVQHVIDQMENYKSIKILVITGGKNGAPVNLENLIAKAAHYPLQQLYIINFKSFLTRVPKTIGNFRDLNFLALYNNRISQLPAEIGLIIQLKSLYIELNPVVTLLPAINTLNKLDALGIAKTQIGEDEISRIKQQLPNCKIIQQ